VCPALILPALNFELKPENDIGEATLAAEGV